MKISKLYLLLLLPFSFSCKTYQMLEGKSSAVSFTADASVFNDSAFRRRGIGYTDLLGIRGNFINVIDLKQDEAVTAIIHEPTFFIAYGLFLVYPGENILVKKGADNDFVFEIEGDKQRNKELLFFKLFDESNTRVFVPRVDNMSIDTILAFEKRAKAEISAATIVSQRLFDSLANALQVSDKFKSLTKHYVENNSSSVLLSLYEYYKDTLLAHQMYKQKCEELASSFNGIEEKSKMFGLYIGLNDLTDKILPVSIWRMSNVDQFQSCFDTIQNTFDGLSREYLLTRLMYDAYKKRITVPADYATKYETICVDKEYKELMGNVMTQREKNDDKASKISDNSLVAFNSRKVIGLEDILEKQKGKVILIDFWASWCAPCLEQIPDLQKLKKEYSDDQVVFLHISLDREIQPWQKAIVAKKLETNKNYMLNNAGKSSFIEQYNIHSIPRYMLIDKEGKMINPDAPIPGDPKLKEAIEKLLHP